MDLGSGEITADRLLKWGLTVDTTYNLCQAFEETREHLFIH